MSNPIIEVNEGKLKGIAKQTDNKVNYFTFKGIPYAKPPIGDLRFASPLPPEPWEGVRDATKDCNICAQYDMDSHSFLGDEDCLYLNVYTPKLPSNETPLLPVMLLIHGGGFLFGNGTDETLHGPEYLIEKDVIVVGFNYRVGILGFLSLGLQEAPKNVGLRDKVQALKWIKENIAKFGGDPNNVTLFGLSSGGSSMEYLLLAPSAEGLFHKAISHSGSSLLHWARNDQAKLLASRIPSLKGCDINDDQSLLQFLKELPTEELVTLSIKACDAELAGGKINFCYVPSIETPNDWQPFFNENAYDKLSRGDFIKVPMLTGFCEREGLMMCAHKSASIESVAKEQNLIDYFPFDFVGKEEEEMKVKLKSIYVDGESKFPETDNFAVDFFSDIDFIGGIYVSAKLIAQHSNPVYFFEFAYDGKLNLLKKKLKVNRPGACHADDTGYLLNSYVTRDVVATDSDLLVKNRMLEMWTNFVKYSNPTPNVDGVIITTKWEPVTENKINCMVINDKLTLNDNIYPERMKLFDDLYKKFRVAK